MSIVNKTAVTSSTPTLAAYTPTAPGSCWRGQCIVLSLRQTVCGKQRHLEQSRALGSGELGRQLQRDLCLQGRQQRVRSSRWRLITLCEQQGSSVNPTQFDGHFKKEQAMNKLLLYALAFVIFLLVSSVAHAAELRGRLTGISGTTIQVRCGDFHRSAPTGNDGSYAIVGLPTGRTCSFIVTSGNASSVSIPFNTTRSVTIFNGRLRRQNEIILVIRR